MPSRILLIDADSIVYAAAASAQTKVAIEGGMYHHVADVEQGRCLFDAALGAIRRDIGGRPNLFLNDVGGNWRRAIMPTYKGNRDPSKRPLLFDALRDYAMEVYGAQWFPMLEADDAVGMHSSLPLSTMVSIDKDLNTVPGSHYNPGKPSLGVYNVTEEEADQNHLRQTVLGDSVDAYGGAKGFGKKKLEAFLKGRPLTWALVLEIYAKVGMTEGDALQTAQGARILRSKREYVKRTNTVKRWRPR